MTRQPCAHDAVLAMDPAGDARAPGGAITLALCGSWNHEPPCPVAAHHTGHRRDGDQLRLRILFAAEPDDEAAVRATIDDALRRGTGDNPEGSATDWRLLSAGPSDVMPEEREHAARLVRS